MYRVAVRRWGVLCLVAVLVPATASATPQDLFGAGGRTTALAMTGTSYVETYEAVYANPAGLAAARRRALYLGVQAAGYHLEIDGQPSFLTPARGLAIGFHLPLPFGDVLQDRLVIGGVFFTPAEVLLRGKVQDPEAIQWSVLDRAQVLAVQIGLGIDLRGLVDGLSIGAGFSALANVIGSLDVRLDETNAFTSVVETQLITTFSPTVGARWVQPPSMRGSLAEPEYGFGITYRHEVLSRMTLDIVTSDLPVELPVLSVGGLVQYDPPTLLAEGFYRPIPDLMLVLGLTTRFWSAWPGAQVPTSSNSYLAPAPDFSIVPSPRIAAEGRFADERFVLALRGGYAFEPSPAPAARMAQQRDADGMPRVFRGEPVMIPLRMVDNDRHVFTLGAGITMLTQPRVVIDAYVQLHVLSPRTHAIGRADGAPNMQSGGFVMAGGWLLGVEF